MQPVYDRLAREGKIGPTDDRGQIKPDYYKEYPKWVKGGDGKDVIVQDRREELAVSALTAPGQPEDPVVAEKNRLAQAHAELQRKYEDIQRELESHRKNVPMNDNPRTVTEARPDATVQEINQMAGSGAPGQPNRGVSEPASDMPKPANPERIPPGGGTVRNPSSPPAEPAMPGSSQPQKSSTATNPLPNAEQMKPSHDGPAPAFENLRTDTKGSAAAKGNTLK